MQRSDRIRPVRSSAVAVLAAVALLLAACSDDTPDDAADTGTTTTAAAAEDEPGLLKIGVIAPLEDGLTAFGDGILSSVQLAVDEANDRDAVPGFTIEVVALDDSSDPELGRDAAEEMAGDPSVLGVVGPYNSGVATEVAPVLQEAGIPIISPSNTDPTLTVGTDPDDPQRQFDNYFRMVATDAEQGPLLATYALDELDAVTAVVVSEDKPVSSGLADDFAAGFTGDGGTVLHAEVVPDEDLGRFDDVFEEMEGLDEAPDVLFFGGEYSVAATFRDAAAAAGFDAPLLGGDGIKDDAFITEAEGNVDGTIASTVGVPLEDLDTAAEFTAAYEDAGFEDAPTDYGPYAYDATNLLIGAAEVALADGDAVTDTARAEVIAELDAVETEGATGTIGFDDHGDTTAKVFTIYRVEGGAWVPIPDFIGFEV